MNCWHVIVVLQRPARACALLQIWRCPGPCRTQTRGGFARNETLKQRLFPKYAKCKEAVLRVLDLESIPESSIAWMAYSAMALTSKP